MMVEIAKMRVKKMDIKNNKETYEILAKSKKNDK